MKKHLYSVAVGLRGPLAFLLALLAALAARAQAPAWQTAAALDGPVASGGATVTASATDDSGNVYLVGSFSGTARFGRINLTETGFGKPSAIATSDAFVAKWSPVSKDFVWARQAGYVRNGSDAGSAVVVQGTSVYVGGTFTGDSLRLGRLALPNTSRNLFEPGTGTPPNPSYPSDSFVAKLTDAGDFVWVRVAGYPDGTDELDGVAVNGTSVYATGISRQNNGRYSTLFISKFTDSGSTAILEWSQWQSSAAVLEVRGVAASGNSVYLTGFFASNSASPATINFGTTPALTAPNGAADVFVVRLADAGHSGRFVWSRRAGGTGADIPSAIAVQEDTDVYVTGTFGDAGGSVGNPKAPAPADFGPTTLTAANGAADVFVAKLWGGGFASDFVWARRAGGPGPDVAPVLAASPAGVYVAGTFASATADFGGTTLTKTGSADNLYVAKLVQAGPTGDYVWAQQASGTAAPAVRGLSVRGATVSAIGTFSGTYNFGSLGIGDPNTAPIPFVATLRDATTAPPAAYRLNAGGGALNTARSPFAADQYYYYSADTHTFATTAPITGTPAPALYQTERYGSAFGYPLPVANGQYTVVLHFAEIYWTAAGKRLFDVGLEGSKVLDNYDIYKKVGANAAITETFIVTVTDGVLNVDLSALPADGGVDQAKLSALEVLPASPVYRLNAGGGALATSRGTFAADQYYSADSRTYATAAAIAGTPDPALYQTERYSANGRLGYALPVANGQYTVVLHFAEIYWQQAGQRLFDVSLEGAKVLDDYDIYKKVGANVATTETFVVAVTDGVLNLDLSALPADGGLDQAKVSAIEVFSGTGSGTSSRLAASRGAQAGAAAEPATAFSAYPNPTNGRFTVACTANVAQGATLLLTDQLGRVAQQQSVQLQPGRNEVVLQAGAQAPGLYVLTLHTADGQRQRLKVLVQP